MDKILLATGTRTVLRLL